MRSEFDSNRPHYKRDRPAYLVWLLRKSMHEFANGALSVSRLTDDIESIVGSLEEVAACHSIYVTELQSLWGELEVINAIMHYEQRAEPDPLDLLEIEKIIRAIEGVLSQAGFASNTYHTSE